MTFNDEPCQYLNRMDSRESNSIYQDHEIVRKAAAGTDMAWHSVWKGGVLGSVTGLAGFGVGAEYGTMIAPGIGTAVGALAGGLVGGISGAYEAHNRRIEAVGPQIEHRRVDRLTQKMGDLSREIRRYDPQDVEAYQMEAARDHFAQTVCDYNSNINVRFERY